jgi:hypothetical protein
MPKRSAEQALRDEHKAATKERDLAKERLRAAQAQAEINAARVAAAEKKLQEAVDRRIRATLALEALLGRLEAKDALQEDAEQEEVTNGESAAPAATGADAEVQPDRKDDKK